MVGHVAVTSLVAALRSRFSGQEYGLPAAAELRSRSGLASTSRPFPIEQAMAAMTDEAAVFFEHVAFGLLIDYRRSRPP